MLHKLTDDEKLRLLRFLATFAWTDLDVGERERALVLGLIDKFRLSAADAALAASWLDHPPAEEDIDPQDIPAEHRRLVLDAAAEMFRVDGQITALEEESYALLVDLLADA